MKKPWIIALSVLGGLVLIGGIFLAGLFIGHFTTGMLGNRTGGMMDWNTRSFDKTDGHSPYDYRGTFRDGMMGGTSGTWRDGRPGRGMLDGFGTNAEANAQPLTVDQARTAVEAYLKDLNDPDLQLAEIMVFDNNAYARITEKSTGIGAMELLVDPATLAVTPEYGPNMMWNLKYGHMGSFGGMMGGYGGMMGGQVTGSQDVSSEMTVSPEQALTLAQAYLDQRLPGYKTAADADPFYGYYTIDILQDGQVAGMLSVNGFSGQVWLHTWHGTFLEMWE